MLNIHYDLKTGDIKSFQEGPQPTEKEDVPAGCGLISVESSNDFFVGGNIAYKVDVAEKTLVPLRAPNIVG